LSFFLRGTNRESDSGALGSSLSDKALLAGIMVLTALVYLPTLTYEFVYDDQGIIVENALVQSWRFVPQYFQGQVWQHLFPNAPANYYRPLSVLMFRINDALFGLHPMGWHAYALLLHLLATALVFWIVRRITDRPLVAAVSALLFGVHPTHHEVVAWVTGTTESLCAVLFLAAFLAYLKSRARWTAGWMSLSCLLYAAGLLAKETAAVLPALIFAHSYLYGIRDAQAETLTPWRRFVQAATRASVYVPIVILYLVVRIHVLHGFSHAQTSVALPTLLLTLPSVLFFYLHQWLLPVRLSEFYDLPLRMHWDLLHVALPLAALGAAAGALWYFRRQLGSREVVFALAAITVPLLPAMNLSVFAAGELVHDRYSYLPGLGVALIAALALQPLFKGRLVFGMPQRLVLVMLAIILPLSYSAANASSYWVDDSVLFEHAHSVAPQNATARNNYAVQLALHGDEGTALTMLQDLVRERPDFFLGTYNLGRLLYETDMLGASEHFLQQASSIDPGMPDTYLQLGMIRMRTGRESEAEAQFRHALALRPNDPKIHFALGVVLALRGNCPSARAEFSQALSLNPGLVRAQEQMDKCGAATAARDVSLPAVIGLPLPSPAARAPLAPVKGP
jgi:protein O-mannosyl-transferase